MGAIEGLPWHDRASSFGRSGASTAIIGVAAGLAVTLTLSRFLSAFLYGVTPLDPVVYAFCAGGVLVVTALASLVPALAAKRLAPAAVLRDD